MIAKNVQNVEQLFVYICEIILTKNCELADSLPLTPQSQASTFDSLAV